MPIPSINPIIEDQHIIHLQEFCNSLALGLGLDFDGVKWSIDPPVDGLDLARKATWRTNTNGKTVGGYFMIYEADIDQRRLELLALRSFCFEASLMTRPDQAYINSARKLWLELPGEESLWKLAVKHYWRRFHRWIKGKTKYDP